MVRLWFIRVQRWLERAQDQKERVQDHSDLDFLVKTVMTSGPGEIVRLELRSNVSQETEVHTTFDGACLMITQVRLVRTTWRETP
jgi:hypothetical protein